MACNRSENLKQVGINHLRGTAGNIANSLRCAAQPELPTQQVNGYISENDVVAGLTRAVILTQSVVALSTRLAPTQPASKTASCCFVEPAYRKRKPLVLLRRRYLVRLIFTIFLQLPNQEDGSDGYIRKSLRAEMRLKIDMLSYPGHVVFVLFWDTSVLPQNGDPDSYGLLEQTNLDVEISLLRPCQNGLAAKFSVKRSRGMHSRQHCHPTRGARRT